MFPHSITLSIFEALTYIPKERWIERRFSTSFYPLLPSRVHTSNFQFHFMNYLTCLVFLLYLTLPSKPSTCTRGGNIPIQKTVPCSQNHFSARSWQLPTTGLRLTFPIVIIQQCSNFYGRLRYFTCRLS